MKLTLFSLFSLFATAAVAAPAAPGWRFDLKAERSGIVALEAIVVSPTLVVFFDRASDDPLQINNHSAWGALWNLETSTVKPLDVLTNSFCASGALLSNGTMVGRSCIVILGAALIYAWLAGQCWRGSSWVPWQPRHRTWPPGYQNFRALRLTDGRWLHAF